MEFRDRPVHFMLTPLKNIELPTTRKECLSLIAPYLLKPKKDLQHLCTLKLGWDDVIPEEKLTTIWKWQETLDQGRDHEIPR
jgi:hypothetical protein